MTELDRLQDLGWEPVRADTTGVRGHHHSAVSYPRGGLDMLGLGGGEGFWFDHRAEQVSAALRRHRQTVVWDVGAGGGSMASRLAAAGFEVMAVEPLREGAEAIAALGVESFCATLDELRLPGASIPVVGLFDVIEHIDDPGDLLGEVHRVLRPGGFLLVTVPAMPWLWSDEDDAAGHFRRYTRHSLDVEMASAGFGSLGSRYLFASLVPLAALLRALPYRLGRRRTTPQVLSSMGEQLTPSRNVDRLARLVLRGETALAKRWGLPFGLSLLGIYSSSRRDGQGECVGAGGSWPRST